MAIGPVQLLVLGFEHPTFEGEIIAELERLRESDTVRVIDALAVFKDADGDVEIAHLSNLSRDEAVELGSKVGALIGLGIDGEEGAIVGAEAGAEATEDGVHVFNDDEAWDVLEDIQNDSAAALILIEHPLGRGPARRDRARRRFPSRRRLYQSARPGRNRTGQPGRGRRAARSRKHQRPHRGLKGDINMMGSRRVARRTAIAREARESAKHEVLDRGINRPAGNHPPDTRFARRRDRRNFQGAGRGARRARRGFFPAGNVRGSRGIADGG